MADKSIDDIFADILKDTTAIAREVIEDVALRVQQDIMLEAYDYLNRYYRNFGTPKRYRRTYQLRKSITPILKGKTIKEGNKKTMRITVGVSYDSEQLEGLYHSNSPWHQSGEEWISRTSEEFNWNKNADGTPIGDNGIPQPAWIMENFLKGVHVWGAAPDQRKVDAKSATSRLMRKFINKDLQSHIASYTSDALMRSISKRV